MNKTQVRAAQLVDLGQNNDVTMSFYSDPEKKNEISKCAS